jgi:oligosaccharide repeat unit polymerase
VRGPALTWLSAAIFLLLPAIAWAARRSGGSWYSPAAFFAAFWCVVGGLPLIAGQVSVLPAGMLFVVAACAAVLLGAWAAQRRATSAAVQRPLQEPPLLGWLIAACTLIGLAVVVLILYSVETRGGAPRLTSFHAIVDTIHQLAIARNGGTWEEPAAARVLTSALYLGPMLSGLMIAARRTGSARWLSLVVFVPSVMVTVILTTKSSILLPMALGVSAYVATSIAAGNPPRFTLKGAAWLAGLVVLLAGAFVLIQMARYAGWSQGRPLAVVQLLWADVFPYLGAFSIWFQGKALSASLHPTLGQYTFAGVFEVLHIHSRVAGLYTDQVMVNGVGYNIYTAFRGLIEDFTIPGALLFLGAVGFGAELAYRRVRSGDLVYVGLLAAFYAATLWSFVVDVFIYNTIVLAFLVLVGYLALATRPSIRRATGLLERPPRVSKADLTR